MCAGSPLRGEVGIVRVGVGGFVVVAGFGVGGGGGEQVVAAGGM